MFSPFIKVIAFITHTLFTKWQKRMQRKLHMFTTLGVKETHHFSALKKLKDTFSL